MAEALSPADIATQVAARQREAGRSQVLRVEERYTYVRPLLGAAYDLIDWMGNTEHKLMFGLPEVDAALRGIGPGELCYLTGRAHSGKTQLILNLLRSNPLGHYLYFTPDEVDNLVLCKLIALVRGVNAMRLEERVKAGDAAVERLITTVASETFPNLLVLDQGLTFDQMRVALHEAEDLWQHRCEGVFIDYLDLLPGEADYNGTKSKSTHLKKWTKRNRVPVVCIHQPKRGGAARGSKIGMDDMNMGGETEATFVLGVRRRRDDPWDEQAWLHKDTISVNIDKNKRPPCHVGEYDYYLDPENGTIRSLRPEDLVVPGAPINNVATATAVIERTQRKRLDSDQVIDLALAREQRHPSA